MWSGQSWSEAPWSSEVPAAPAGPQVFTVTLTDTLMLPDAAMKHEEHLYLDKVFVDDAVIAQAIRQMLGYDTLLLADFRMMSLSMTAQDQLLLLDALSKVMERTERDALLITDSGMFSVLREMTLVDTLLLGDEISKELTAMLIDRLFLFDSYTEGAPPGEPPAGGAEKHRDYWIVLRRRRKGH